MLGYFTSSVLFLGVVGQSLRRGMHRRDDALLLEQFAQSIETVASALRAGSSFLQALTLTLSKAKPPYKVEFSQIVDDYRLGLSLEESIARLCVRRPLPEFRFFHATVHLAQTSGTSLATLFERLTQSLRDKREIQQQVSALSAQGLLQAWVLGLLPAILFLAMRFLDADLIRQFLAHRLAEPLLSTVIVLEALAIVCMQKLIRIEV